MVSISIRKLSDIDTGNERHDNSLSTTDASTSPETRAMCLKTQCPFPLWGKLRRSAQLSPGGGRVDPAVGGTSRP